MFDVLMYLFETYIHTEAELRVDQDKLEQDLTDAGFEREDIYNALLSPTTSILDGSPTRQ